MPQSTVKYTRGQDGVANPESRAEELNYWTRPNRHGAGRTPGSSR
jgi:hypothetical protein